MFNLAASPAAPGFKVGRVDPLDNDFVASTIFVSGCLPFTDDVAIEEFDVRVIDPTFFKPLPVPTRPAVLVTPFPFSLPFTLPSLLALSITIVVVLDVGVVGLKPMLVFGRDGIGAFNRSKAFDKLTKLAGL